LSQDRVLGLVLILLGAAGVAWYFFVVPNVSGARPNAGVIALLAVVGIGAGIGVLMGRNWGLWSAAFFFSVQVPKYFAQDFILNVTLGLNLTTLLHFNSSSPYPFAAGVDWLSLGLLGWTLVRLKGVQPREVEVDG
jgi:hypothetical protein